MKIFLTGATGFLGKNFCKAAIKKGHKIFAPTRKRMKSKNIKWLKGEFDNNWKKELLNSDIIVHLASAGVRRGDVKNIYETNVFRSLNLFKNAIKYNCKKWLIISTSSEYGIRSTKPKKISTSTNRVPYTDYGLSKAILVDECINLARKNKCKCRVMRLFPLYGRHETKSRLYPSLIKAIKKGNNFRVRNPNETRNFSNVEYISKILVDALDFKKNFFSTYQIWHASEKKIYSVKDFVKKVWKDNRAKGKVYYGKNRPIYSHISSEDSLWKLKF